MTYSKKLLAVALAVVGSVSAANAQTKPNVVIVYTDDQGYGDVSYLNPESKFQTPNMDRIAAEGINFSHGHSGGTACTPSRYALLTGRYAWRTHLKRSVGSPDEDSLIAEDRLTLGEMLRREGYHTACIGKWHLGMILPGASGNYDWSKPIEQGPVDRGFDYWYGIPVSPKVICAWFENRSLAPGAAAPSKWTYHQHNPLDREVERWRVQPPYYDQLSDQPKETIQNKMQNFVATDWSDDMLLTRYTDKAMEWISSKADDAKNGKPFFVYFSLTSPHEPVAPHPDFVGKTEAGAYGDFMFETDYHVGRLMAHLEKLGIDDNTMIIFSSDNGAEVAMKKRIPAYGHNSSGPLAGMKRYEQEGGHRVPFAIRWPAGIQGAGREWAQPVNQSDIFATLADLLGVEVPANAAEDSQSFLDVLTNPNSEHFRLPMIAYNNRNGRFAVTEGKWKLTLPMDKKKATLHNLSADIGEKNNIISQHPEIAEALEAKLTQIVCNGRTTAGPRQTNDTGWWSSITWLTPEEYKALHPEGDPVPKTQVKSTKSKKK